MYKITGEFFNYFSKESIKIWMNEYIQKINRWMNEFIQKMFDPPTKP